MTAPRTAFLLRIPLHRHTAAREAADWEGETLTHWINAAIDKAVYRSRRRRKTEAQPSQPRRSWPAD